MTRLSTGLKINTAQDNPSGLAISEGIRSHIGGLRMAKVNIGTGKAALGVAENALNEITNILQELRNLAVRGADANNGTDGQAALAADFVALKAELDRISGEAEFNGDNTLDAGYSAVIQVSVDASDTITAAIGTAITAAGLSIDTEVLTDTTTSASAITALDTAITTVQTTRSTVGSLINRLTIADSEASARIESLTTAESTIRDADIAEETANLTKFQILQQAGLSVLSQANAAPQAALALLQ